ncbi:DUF421 domain-containing protein (plasmid) [Bacillus sp. JZ8]|nr:DUF421 domain-containing protein [Priestia filamentosa]
MMDYLIMTVELLGGYIFLFVVVKILGKTQISQITPFDFISALVLGEFVGSAVFDKNINLLKVLFVIAMWGLLIYITETFTQKSRRMRYLFEGRPSIIINRGHLDWKAMKKNRLDIDQLQQLLRSKDIFSIKEVEYAILENNGSLNVLRKHSFDSPTSADLNVKPEKRFIPLTFISDGEVLWENIKKAGLNKSWLQKQLANKNISTLEQVSYAEWEPDKSLYIQKY